jgi:hypothetical protein
MELEEKLLPKEGLIVTAAAKANGLATASILEPLHFYFTRKRVYVDIENLKRAFK